MSFLVRMSSDNNNSTNNNGILKDERDHPHMLGSYRGNSSNHGNNGSSINSSKFADRFSGLLPSFGSKFHHSKPQQQQPEQPTQQQTPKIEVSLENKLVTSVMNGGGITINSPHDMLNTPDPEPPVQFPTSSNCMMLNTPVRNRQRNNTAPINWGSVSSTTPHLTRSTTNYSENSIWSSNDLNPTNSIPIMNQIGLNDEGPNSNTNLNISHNTVRKRSQTMATYDMPQPIISIPQRVSSPMSLNMLNGNNNNNNPNNTPPHIPIMQDDVDPFSLVWITTCLLYTSPSPRDTR